ncbi:MAG: hypothetical protein HETSPECPRED_009090 [Heterodermia speciosa]|uniref:CS domain-containing protein n=1 Tax=Heterodermia speciosa TaxID=116794 RepID=A0A8H3G6U8_9LECA|nr:MAG: hypothetical protein HETSPECPRED_009090 [Heterodermia speciosa]
MSAPQTTPEVLWAQRSSSSDPEKNYITLTISAPDTEKPSIELKSNSLTFTGHSETKKTTYHVEIEFYGEIDVENSKTHATSANVSFLLRKKELKEEYWPRLLKDSKRVHYLKTDFDKWVDEDEQDGAPDDIDAMGGGMPDMGGMGGDGGFGNIDFSKLGAGGGADGMPDLGGAGGMDFSKLGGAGDDDEAGDDDDDDEMPGLEGDDKDAGVADKAEEAEGKGKAKTQEVS